MADVMTGTFSLAEAKTGQECQLAMQELWLTGRVLPVGARLVVRHTFRSAEQRPLEVVYSFALPADAALRRFRVTGEGFSVRSELKPVKEAVEAYEKGIEEGHLSVLTRQYRDGVVNLNLGNLKPGERVTVYLEVVAGVEAHDNGFRFRFPFALAPAYHARARAMTVRPGEGEMELPLDEFGDVILPRWVEDPASLHRVGFDIHVIAWDVRDVSSPSHRIRVSRYGHQDTETPLPSPIQAIMRNLFARERQDLPEADLVRVCLGTGNDVPNRDLVLDVTWKKTAPLIFSGLDKKGTGRFAAVIPSREFGEPAVSARNVVFVLDRSGSMSGAPMEQARKAVQACIGALEEKDSFGLVAFDTLVETFRSHLVKANNQEREAARQFLSSINARGGTELLAGLKAAASLLAEAGGDIMVVTDGQVAGTEDIIAGAKAEGIRIFCLGIGSASQDRFLTLLARQTGGVSRFLTPRERVDMGALELFAAQGRPVASELRAQVTGLPGAQVTPQPSHTLFKGMPLVLFGSTQGPGHGMLELSWHSGDQPKSMSLPLPVPEEDGMGETLKLLQGARLITDMEAKMGALGIRDYGGPTALERRQATRQERALQRLSSEFGLASLLMCLVAVVERAADQPGAPPVTQVVPVGLPEDVTFPAYFGPLPCAMPAPAARAWYAIATKEALCRTAPQAIGPDEVLVELAAKMEQDGGLPGKDGEERVVASLLALLLFASEGHTAHGGPFAAHMQRLLVFLKAADLSPFDQAQRDLIARALQAVEGGEPVSGKWIAQARTYLTSGRVSPARFWKALRKALP